MSAMNGSFGSSGEVPGERRKAVPGRAARLPVGLNLSRQAVDQWLGDGSRIATTILQALRRPPSPPLLAGTLPAVCAASLYPALGPANGKCGRPGPGRGQSI